MLSCDWSRDTILSCDWSTVTILSCDWSTVTILSCDWLQGSVLVFVTKKQNCEELAHNLKVKAEIDCR